MPIPTERPRIALIHALAESVAPIHAAFAAHWPEAVIFDLLDTSLARDLVHTGLDEAMVRRFVTLGQYAERSVGEGGRTAALLFTCSAFGPAIDAVKRAVSIPALKPNEAAFEDALSYGPRIGLLVSFAPSRASLSDELRAHAARLGQPIHIEARVVEGALDALKRGDVDSHDRYVAQAAEQLTDVDSLVLGQFSLARAAAAIEPRPGRRVITTPASAVLKLKTLLAPRTFPDGSSGAS